MIDAIDNMLCDLIQSRVSGLSGTTQVAFEPPNPDWRTAVVTAAEERLNLYLVDVRENLKLRSNERSRELRNGWYVDHEDPPKLDCHYLITAWSPIVLTPTIEPSRDEHALLYQVAQVLFQNRSIVVSDVYAPGITIPSGRKLNPDVPLLLRDEELPIAFALPDGMRDLAEFWSTMQLPWRPALHLVVTVPVFLLVPDRPSPPVTTELVDYQQDGLGTSELWLTIGGHVLNGTSDDAVGGARVHISGLNPIQIQSLHQHVVTGADGRFRFVRLPAGQYLLQAVAGAGSATRTVDLPSPSGEYDLRI